MWSLFGRKNNSQNIHANTHSTLPSLDKSLYPIQLGSRNFASPSELLLAIIDNDLEKNPDVYSSLTQEEMSRRLYDNDIYQDWINFTVFGRYVQRSFSIFYQQSDDIFNTDMPELLRHELMRHAQYLPNGQTLFFAGQLPLTARQEKLFTTTVNPMTAYTDAVKSPINHQTIINQVVVNSPQLSRSEIGRGELGRQCRHVLGFAIRHNARTSERLRNEVMILHFRSLRLVKEEQLIAQTNTSQSDSSERFVLLRHYELS